MHGSAIQTLKNYCKNRGKILSQILTVLTVTVNEAKFGTITEECPSLEMAKRVWLYCMCPISMVSIEGPVRPLFYKICLKFFCGKMIAFSIVNRRTEYIW